jgi:histidine ammonia-lyase
LEDLALVAVEGLPLELTTEPAFEERIRGSVRLLQQALDGGVPVYGVSTGFGGACGNRIPTGELEALGRNLIRYHGCGAGEPLPIEAVRGAMLSRLLCFRRGYSGVTWGLCQKLVSFLNAHITPVVPAMGSVGASGDLTPMSYVAAALAGEREVYYRGHRMATLEALRLAGIEPYRFRLKEPLATLNGTSIMTGIAILVVLRSRRLLAAASAAAALSVHALAGHTHHVLPVLFRAKPFPGAAEVAERLRMLLGAESAGRANESEAPEALQDPYSLRCTPHVLGVLADALAWIGAWVEIEANGADDNPLLDPETGRVVMGGNFYGGHIAFAMDSLKAALASAADLCDRQVALLVDPRFSRGLPAGLVDAENGLSHAHHGFKGLQITISALAAEALHGTLPAASFSRSTESHNQDKVSMGTIAARDALRVLNLVEAVVAGHLITAAQACDLRGQTEARPELVRLVASVRKLSARVAEDRPLDSDLARVQAAIANGTLHDELGS